MSAGGRRKQDGIALALLILLVVAAFANVVFRGRSLVPSENLNPLDPRPDVHVRGPDFIPPAEWERRDLVPYPNTRDITAATMQSDPSREFLRRSLARGEFPFWDPYLGGGGPSFASLVPAYLFPPSLVVALLGNGSVVNNVYALLLIFTSGALTYFFLRRYVTSWPAALAGGIAFAFSGAVIQTAPSFFGQAVAFFSLPLLVTARLIELPSARRAAQLALAFAFVALATFPPILMQSFGMCVVYLVVALAAKRGSRAETAAWFAAGAAVSLAMTAFAYLPGVKLMAELPHVQQYYAHAAEDTMPLVRLGQALSPTIMGGPPIYAHPALLGRTGKELYYSGVVALLLAGIGALAVADVRGGRLRTTALLCAAGALAKIFGIAPVQWIASVPFLRDIHYAAYFGIVVAYAVALLAALGTDALLNGRARRWHVLASAVTLAVALLVMRLVAAHGGGIEQRSGGLQWLADFRRLVLFSAIAVVLAGLAAAHFKRGWVAATLVVALLAFEGITNSIYPRPRRWNVWEHPPRYVELLVDRNSGGRVLPMPRFPANTESVFRQPTLDAILTASPRMFELYGRYFGPLHNVFLRDTRRIPPERVLDVANVEYLAIAAADVAHVTEAVRRGYATLFADDYVFLVRRPTDPRYSFTSSYQTAKPAEALAALETLPRGSVLLEQPASFASAPPVGLPVQPRLTKFALNSEELAVDAPRAGLLVCSESNMNGWTATVDGRPAAILPANYAFRAVEVPAGSHTIRLAYEAPGWNSGVAIALIGCLICACGLLPPGATRHLSSGMTIARKNGG